MLWEMQGYGVGLCLERRREEERACCWVSFRRIFPPSLSTFPSAADFLPSSFLSPGRCGPTPLIPTLAELLPLPPLEPSPPKSSQTSKNLSPSNVPPPPPPAPPTTLTTPNPLPPSSHPPATGPSSVLLTSRTKLPLSLPLRRQQLLTDNGLETNPPQATLLRASSNAPLHPTVMSQGGREARGTELGISKGRRAWNLSDSRR